MVDSKTKEKILLELISLTKQVFNDDEEKAPVEQHEPREVAPTKSTSEPTIQMTSSEPEKPPKKVNSIPPKKKKSEIQLQARHGKLAPKALDQEILQFIRERGRVRAYEVADNQNHGRSATYMLLRRLVEEKQLRVVKEDRCTYFELRPFVERNRTNGTLSVPQFEQN